MFIGTGKPQRGVVDVYSAPEERLEPGEWVVGNATLLADDYLGRRTTRWTGQERVQKERVPP